MKTLQIPMAVSSDSYKAGHYMMYPGADKMVAYGEFRAPYPGQADQRIVFHGIRYIVENFLEHQWTVEEVEMAEKFYSTHNAGNTPYPFPKNLFLKFIKENNGYFPVKVEALPEGTVIYPHVPVYQITAEAPYAVLCTFLETLMTMVWYPTTVATLSRHVRTIVERFFEETVDPENNWKIDSRLHDFGYRGCTSQEQAVIGGVAHLLNFGGSDTMAAAFYAQFHLNGGKPVASSIPATEHSVMTAWPNEQMAVENMMEMFGQNDLVNKLGIFATVGDSYDYKNFLENIVPVVAQKYAGKWGLWVLRPDSGDPVACVVMGLHAAERAFGVTVNSKGFKVLKGAAIIQGDGITITEIEKILEATKAEGFSVENVAFGMGAGLLQKVNRDTMSFATKLSHIQFITGAKVDVMKRPNTDSGKYSLPGIMKVAYERGCKDMMVPRVFPIESETGPNLLEVVYNCGPVTPQWPLFDQIREKIKTLFAQSPEGCEAISTQMHHKIAGLLGAGK